MTGNYEASYPEKIWCAKCSKLCDSIGVQPDLFVASLVRVTVECHGETQTKVTDMDFVLRVYDDLFLPDFGGIDSFNWIAFEKEEKVVDKSLKVCD